VGFSIFDGKAGGDGGRAVCMMNNWRELVRQRGVERWRRETAERRHTCKGARLVECLKSQRHSLTMYTVW